MKRYDITVQDGAVPHPIGAYVHYDDPELQRLRAERLLLAKALRPHRTMGERIAAEILAQRIVAENT